MAVLASGSDKDKKRIASSGAENDRVEIQATVMLDQDDIRSALGVELPPGIAIVQIKAIPKGDDPLSIGRDDFTLVSHRDGQRSGPYSPGQIAGKDVLVVAQRQVDGGGGYAQNRGPTWGGIPGTMGRPRQMPGGPGSVGTAPSQTAGVATVKTDKEAGTEKDKISPLLAALEAKVVPDAAEAKEPVGGFLYFPLGGKQKTKDLELLYKGPAGRLFIPFK